MAIDPRTLAAISGQQAFQAAQGFQGSMQNLYQTAIQGQQNQRAQEQHAQQQKIAELQYKTSVGDAVMKSRALQAEPPSMDASPDDWMKYGRTQELGGYAVSAKQAYDFAEALKAPEDMPDEFKSYPEIAKLQVLRRRALAAGRLEEAKEMNTRIAKLKDKTVTQPRQQRVESSKQSAANISTVLSTTLDIQLEGEEALALGDLSRSLTDRASQENLAITQSEMNDRIAQAYAQILNERTEAMGAWDWIPFNNPARPTKMDVESRVIKNIRDERTKANGNGTETVTDTEEDTDEALIQGYLPPAGE